MAARQPQDGEAAVALATVERRAGPAAPRHARPTRGGRGARVVAWLPACLAVAMGLAIRVEQYLHQRALWFDEGLLALNIIHRPYRRLFDPLAYHQGAPPGFLVAQRTAMHAFGGGEAALRLVPFLGGCLAVVVFAHLAHRVLSRPAALVATVLFALSPFLVYYSNEVKQYSTDALFTVLLLDLAAGLLLAPVRPRRAVGFGLAGAVAVLCSHPAVFVAAGASAVLVAVPLLRRDRVALAWSVLGVGFWAATFAAGYLLWLRRLSADPVLLFYWRAGFPPRPLALGTTLAWLGSASLRVVRNVAALPLPGLAALLLLAGLVGVARRRLTLAALLVAPLPLVLVAAVLGKYPLDRRLALFLVPFVLLLLAGSIDALRLQVGAVPVGAVAAGLLVAVMAVQPVGRALGMLAHPVAVSETRLVLAAVRDRWRPGDRILLETSAEPAYRYYAPRLGLPASADVVDLRRGPCGGPPVAPELRSMPRLWLVLSAWTHSASQVTATDLTPPAPADAWPGERDLIAHLPGADRPLAVVHAPGAAYLIEPAAAPAAPRPDCTRLVRVRPKVPLGV